MMNDAAPPSSNQATVRFVVLSMFADQYVPRSPSPCFGDGRNHPASADMTGGNSGPRGRWKEKRRGGWGEFSQLRATHGRGRSLPQSTTVTTSLSLSLSLSLVILKIRSLLRPPGERCVVMGLFVYLSVCLSVCQLCRIT